MYAIIDIETTSGKFNHESITEIAIYRFDGQTITDQFIALINPEKSISNFVVQLTGITQKMLRNAPKFYQVAKRIIEITEGCVLVGHNVNFDYRVLQNEFKRLGYDFQRKTLCTIALSRLILPRQASYGLHKLTRALGIPLRNHHRAFGDALATLEIFKLLLSKDLGKIIISQTLPNTSSFQLPEKYIRFLEFLPENAGIFRIHNEKGKIIFIEQCANIKYGVLQLFISDSPEKQTLKAQIHHLSFDIIENKLLSDIIFRQEVQKNKPKFSTLNTEELAYSVVLKRNVSGDYLLSMQAYNSKTKAVASFPSEKQAQFFINKINQATQENLSQKKGEISFKKALKEVLFEFGISNQTFIVLFKANNGRKYFLFFEKGVFKGYGFATLNLQLSDLETIKNILHPIKNTAYHQYLIRQHLISTKQYKVIPIQ